MGGILHFFRRLRRGKKSLRLIMLGLDNGGKTTILRKLSDEPIDTIMPTPDFNMKMIKTKGVKLNVWDVGGQSEIRHTWRSYLEGVGSLIYVVDAADPRRMGESEAELLLLLEEEDLSAVPLLVFANKQDLPSALTAAQISRQLRLHMIKDRPWQICPCSAYTGEGLREGIDWIMKAGK